MTQVYLVRHGETEWSLSGQHTSVTDLPLTTQGEARAKLLRGHLNPTAYGLILSSPRQRARRTAELAGFVGDYAPKIEPDLAEWAYGEYEGLTRNQIHEQHDPDWRIWTGPTPGGESPEQIVARMNRLIERIQSAGVDQVLLFGHGHALRALTMVWLGLDLIAGAQFELHTGTIGILSEERDGRTLELWNAPVDRPPET
ncbi:MAG TPA: histidine phosphatase family protein [Propionibacteriaceae bacterium]|nr:histidine phosphatase family protein [Propionibacteriaceae bacterium]